MFSDRHRTWLPLCLLWVVPFSSAEAAAGQIQFNRDIRPILSENCSACHGPDKNRRKAKLRLDVREIALERGAIVPGQPEQSKLVERINATNEDDIMPPVATHKALTPAQKGLLKEWIAAGAEYEPHWAYIKPVRPAVPAPRNARWVRNPIDAFILQTLEAKGIAPSAEADRGTLLRRLSLDLVGLPPTREELSSFLADRSAGAYERQVDRLLASPHFGERMAVPWLDVARFADTVGYHGDQNQNIFPYRDYVIEAFNRNKPFDQFTVEQVAGDLLPGASCEARVATGFNRLNMMTREGGAQPKEYLAKYAADRVRTVSMAWLGSTMGCAECHDHKYDPFSTKDFYQMEAFFADLKQWGVYADYNYTMNPELKGFGNDHPFPPEIEVDSAYLKGRIVKLEGEVKQIESKAATRLARDPQRKPAFEEWRKASAAFVQRWPDGWTAPAPEINLRLKDTNLVAQSNFTVQTDGTILFSGKPKGSLTVTLPLSPLRAAGTVGSLRVAAIRLEIVLPEGAQDEATRRKKHDSASITLTATLRRASGATPEKVLVHDAEANHKQERYAGGSPIVGVKDAWPIATDQDRQSAVWLLDQPVEAKEGDALVVGLGNLAVASARLSVTPFAAADPLQAGSTEPLRRALGHRRASAQEEQLLYHVYVLSTDREAETQAAVRKLQQEIRRCRNGQAWTMVAVAQNPMVTRVLPRGNWQDESGEIVEPAAPHFLPPIPNPEGRRLTRLDLARWLVSADNPLTARTVMNRLWKQFFGTGISAVVDDLGAQGEWPVHPELLDWLACEFMQPSPASASARDRQGLHPWDFKHMIKLMVLSATYRQSSNPSRELRELDPNNRLLACQSPRRLAAEFVRDNALFIAGLLNEDIGGPSAHPYQPAGYYANLQFPDREYYPEPDDRQYRRGVYAHWQRTFLQPMLANFDAPAREECMAARIVSNTPQQALTLLNDPTFVEAARVLAAKALAGKARTDDARLDWAFERALARLAKPKERASLLEFLAEQKEHYQANPEEARKLMHVGLAPAPGDEVEAAAWTQVCRAILNLHETVTRY